MKGLKMPAPLPSSVVYSCTFANYDFTFGPLTRTPNAQFVRYGTTKPNWQGIWRHRPVPTEMEMANQTLTNRNFKFFPNLIAPKSDVAVYIDGNILVRADLSPLIQEFWDSQADIALFPHISGRSLEEEMEFAAVHSIPEHELGLLHSQRNKYELLDLLNTPVTENSILFYRRSSPKVTQIGEQWWKEIRRYCKRDQISLPFVLQQVEPRVHLWDWHFSKPTAKNLYFARHQHRPTGFIERNKSAAFFMKDYSIGYQALFGAIKVGGTIRGAQKNAFGYLRGGGK